MNLLKKLVIVIISTQLLCGSISANEAIERSKIKIIYQGKKTMPSIVVYGGCKGCSDRFFDFIPSTLIKHKSKPIFDREQYLANKRGLIADVVFKEKINKVLSINILNEEI